MPCAHLTCHFLISNTICSSKAPSAHLKYHCSSHVPPAHLMYHPLASSAFSSSHVQGMTGCNRENDT
eukprot:1161600-Pelagomonas_calceolata.AAC.2